MTRFMVANSQAFGPTRCVRGAFGWSLRFALLVCTFVGGLIASVPKLSAQSAAVILITVMDGDRHPLAGVKIEGRSDSALLCGATTDVHGRSALSGCGSAAGLRLTASLAGYVPATTVPLQDTANIEITLSKRMVIQQTTVVQADS